MQDVSNRLNNYCTHTNLDYIENKNIKEEHLGTKKLLLHKKGNTVFANNLLKYLQAIFWNVDFANCFLESEVEYKSKTLNESSSHSSFSTRKSVRKKNLSRIIFAYLNINLLRNKFDTLLWIKLKEMFTFCSYHRLNWMNHFL